MSTAYPELHEFLYCETPDEWVKVALENQAVMLVDHANCEKKAATTALQLMNRYIDRPELLVKMSKLVREEVLHFEQVLKIMKKRNIEYSRISASRYASGLREGVAKNDPDKLIDTLIVGAYIEARSCERFEKIAPYLDEELAKFYTSLLKSEARHFSDYIGLAEDYAGRDISERVAYFGELERDLILSEDSEFRFHSGLPSADVAV